MINIKFISQGRILKMTNAEKLLISQLNTNPPAASIFATGVYLYPCLCGDGLWRWVASEFVEDTYICSAQLENNYIDAPRTEGNTPLDLKPEGL